MQARDHQRLFSQIDAGHRRAAHRHALGKYAAAATDIKHGLALESDPRINVIEPQRIDIVQRFEIARRVPPLVREFAEFGDFNRIDVFCHDGEG